MEAISNLAYIFTVFAKCKKLDYKSMKGDYCLTLKLGFFLLCQGGSPYTMKKKCDSICH